VVVCPRLGGAAEPFLRVWWVFSYRRLPPHFTELEGSLWCS